MKGVVLSMNDIRHSVQLDTEKCKGCTNCIKTCPTQAIRVRNGKAKILDDRCIDCGECIRVCPYHAKKAITDSFDALNKFKYNIAIPAPTLYGQFAEANDINVILNGLLHVGFDDVYEVAYAAEIITKETLRLRATDVLEKPIINSACPAVVKLISTRFPNLINNIIPVISPMQLAGKLAKEKAVEEKGLNADDIGVFFITPCAAKATCSQYPIGLDSSFVDGAISIKDVYLKILPHLKKTENLKPLSRAGFGGISWATSGGEASGAEKSNYIAVDGIHNVLKILDEIDNDKLQDIDFIELLACTGGCVGGPLTVENAFVAKRRVKRLATECSEVGTDVVIDEKDIPNVLWNAPLPYTSKLNLDDDMFEAMRKLSLIEEIYENLPKLDCGSCGSPSCRCLAEDIVRGYTTEDSCIVRFKEKILSLAHSIESAEQNNNIM